ncbi:MAG: TRAP transporter permease [Gammaproteobacteria bacterium]|nr:TRAP transporter permease [Gammaproteobacteria bacterium]MCP5299190.1 TRAP transporter permease [Chromatiaceae bacterium]
MSNEQQTAAGGDAADLVAQVDTGARHPGGVPGKVLFGVPVAWSLFQLWYASPLPFLFGFGVFNNTEARAIHLAFAIFLAFLAFPAFKRSPRDHIPVQDWVFAVLGAFSASYIYIFYTELAGRSGAPTTTDLVVAVIGMLMLLEATRRALGPPLMVVAIVFLIYTFGGPYMPDVIAHKGQSLTKVMSHQWLTTEGVFGIALGVSTSFVFLFVLFGALLEQAGAGNYFIKVAFAMLGHMRGGPAKAAIVASATTGLISGSSIANVATTGTFTIPLMKRVGFPATKAGAVEVAGSTNGQLTPPVMGAAAFLMIEYVGISYIDVIKHAILPAVISYIALVYIVHLEALKANMKGLPKRKTSTLAQKLMTFAFVVVGMCVIGLAVYYGIGWIKQVAGDMAIYIVAVLVAVAYVALLKFATQYPELEIDDPNAPVLELPETGPTVKAGLYFLLPIVVLMWCLIVERFSPGLSAFWATVLMIFIVLTQRPLLAYFRGRSTAGEVRRGFTECIDGLGHGARNMIGIGVATAAAGIIVGTITLTGIGQVMIEFVEFISGGNLMAALIFTAAICIVLGMGLPTTANYIVVSSLMAPVVVSLAAANGLIVPLIAVHMFVFYFGILADDTPPVGLAAFAAAAIAKADPIKTGIQGFMYDIRTAILPFLFIFNTELLLIGIDNVFHLIGVIISATAAMLLFAAATQGYWLVKSRLWESLALLLVAFTLFRPGFWWDEIYPPTETLPATQLIERAAVAPENGKLNMTIKGETLDGKHIEKLVRLPLGKPGTGEDRLRDAGLEIRVDDGKVIADNVAFGSEAQKVGLDFDWEIVSLLVDADIPPKHIMFIPALALLGLVAWLQRRRRDAQSPAPQTA